MNTTGFVIEAEESDHAEKAARTVIGQRLVAPEHPIPAEIRAIERECREARRLIYAAREIAHIVDDQSINDKVKAVAQKRLFGAVRHIAVTD